MIQLHSLRDLFMPHFTHADIVKMRTSLRHSEKLYRNHAELAIKREQCENLIQQLHKESEANLYRSSYQNLKSMDEDSLSIPLLAPLKQQQLEELKIQKRELDSQLDQSEDLTESELKAKKQELLDCIWSVYPTYKAKWEEKWKILQNSLHLEKEFVHLKLFIDELGKHLNIALQQRQKIKGLGVLNYIFGTSPNSIIERHLLGCHQAIKLFDPVLATLIQQTAYRPEEGFLKELSLFLEHLKEQCHKPWSFRHLDTVFKDAHQRLILFHETIEASIKKLKSDQQILNSEFNAWLEQI